MPQSVSFLTGLNLSISVIGLVLSLRWKGRECKRLAIRSTVQKRGSSRESMLAKLDARGRTEAIGIVIEAWLIS